MADGADVPPVDRASFLDSLGGDEELMVQIAGVFLESSPDLVREVREAVSHADGSRLERAAHTLKGAVAYFGAEALRKAAERLERIGRAGDLADAPVALEELEREFQRVVSALEELKS